MEIEEFGIVEFGREILSIEEFGIVEFGINLNFSIILFEKFVFFYFSLEKAIFKIIYQIKLCPLILYFADLHVHVCKFVLQKCHSGYVEVEDIFISKILQTDNKNQKTKESY